MITHDDLWGATTHLCPKPTNHRFYADLAATIGRWKPRSAAVLADLKGLACEIKAGELLRLELLEGPQIVHLYPYNPHDPDERYWAQHTVTTEGLFLTRYGRLWGTMARHRPLLTILEDTVTPPRRAGGAFGGHHPCFSGTSIPARWQYAGGPEGVASGWEQMAALLEGRGLSPTLIKDDACFFQKSRIDPYTQHVELLPSEAVKGDRVTLFAEIDLVVLLALSPFVDGSPPPANRKDVKPRAVRVTTMEKIAEPPGWPYPGIGYPDLSLYLDESGVRSDRPVPTRGRE